MLSTGTRKSTRNGLVLALVATLVVTLLPSAGHCQECYSFLNSLLELSQIKKPQKPCKPQIAVSVPHCPEGVCTGAACPAYCPENCHLRTVTIAVVEVAPACNVAEVSKCKPDRSCCEGCPKCKEAKACCDDCPACCTKSCENCPRCPAVAAERAVRIVGSCESGRCAERNVANEQLQRLCTEQQMTIRQLAQVINQMQAEVGQLRQEVQQMRMWPAMPFNVPNQMVYPNDNPPGYRTGGMPLPPVLNVTYPIWVGGTGIMKPVQIPAPVVIKP